MKLYLVRHARAFEADPVNWPDNGERPLTPDGAKRFRRAARGLRGLAPTVDIVYSSPLTRAWQTAEILHQQAKWPAPTVCDALAGERPPAEVLETLQGLDEVTAVALVGHEPGLHELASYLLAGDASLVATSFRKGGVLALKVEGELLPGTATLEWAATPRMLRALG